MFSDRLRAAAARERPMRRLAVEVAQIVGPPALVGGALVSLLRGQQGGGRWLGSLRPA
eukprot:COSAG04_NODE_8416_length_979_cov_1.232955_1_plen_57_part_10